ncbi:unnamed protein product [Spirodela intermedia]|uniref:Aspartic proteinase Asp1 n=2 Tax=Spirodela intermedia TaxID=51605 RepID=A0A7I8IR63_SPIIN|nr:unnamed protein product [Spirodela intermedia]CAA6660431.1 unnamed protein product [Spirodela intermedia]CAA7396777.1 unnamed protein product [Spirodela intermedia]
MTTALEDRMGLLLLLLLVAACFSSTLPCCSAALDAQRQDWWLPSSPWSELLAIGVGRSSSAVLPLSGNVYPDGLYFVSLSIGNPPKPYFLDVDTGSDLTWLQCDAPCISCSKGPHPLYKPTKDKLVPCGNPICNSLPAAAADAAHGEGWRSGCKSPKDQCDYEVEYADHGSSRGVLIRDAFSIRFVNGSLLRPHLAFGCGYDQHLHGKSSLTDGVLGLGGGRSSVMSQLREQGLTQNVMGHCLSRKGGGFLFFGGDLVPHSGVTWTSMSRRATGHYSPGPADLFFGGRLVGKSFQVIFDSGSSYTYFSSRPYEALLRMLKADLAGSPLEEASDDGTLPLCWRGAKPFRSLAEVRKFFKPVALGFTRAAQLEIPPEGYLILTKRGNVCLGVLNGTQVGLRDFNLIGDISMLDMVMVYDNDRQRIGWARADCNRLPKSDDPSLIEKLMGPLMFVGSS